MAEESFLATRAEFESVAGAIRTKGGTSDALSWPTGFVDAIGAISGGGESYTVEIYLENPLNASEAQDPACIIYESDKRYGERTQIGQIASPTGSAVVNMSKRILTVKFFSDGFLSVPQGSCLYDVHPVNSLDDDEVCFYVEGDGEVRINGVNYDD